MDIEGESTSDLLVASLTCARGASAFQLFLPPVAVPPVPPQPIRATKSTTRSETVGPLSESSSPDRSDDERLPSSYGEFGSCQEEEGGEDG